MNFNYIFDKSYSQALKKLTEFLDLTKSWNLVKQFTFGPDDPIAREILVKNGLGELNSLISNQLFADLKFMSQFDTQEEREIKFKQHFCSTHLFDYMEDLHSRQMCQTAFNAIVKAGGWEYLKTYSPSSQTGFMYDQDPQMNRLMNIVAIADPDHSGFTMAWTMRQLQGVAESGYV